MYSLRNNRLKIPRNDPRSVQDCFLVHGFDIGYEEDNQTLNIFDRALRTLKDVADDAQVKLIPVYTNVRRLHNELYFWEQCFHGAALASVAHCFTKRISRIMVASSHDKENLEPWGSHYLIDPHYSSQDLQVVYDDLMKRYDKTKALAEWDVAFHNFRVCTSNIEGLLNCCRCRKCLRSMVHLEAMGKLKECRAFKIKEISLPDFTDVVKRANLSDFYVHYFEIIEDLRRQGRQDIADIIAEENGWKGKIRRWDGAYLNGSMAQSWHFMRNLVMGKA